MNQPAKPRSFRFSLRMLLIVTAICALASAWLGRSLLQADQQRRAVARVLAGGGYLSYIPPQDSRYKPGLFAVLANWKREAFATVDIVALNPPAGDAQAVDLPQLGEISRLSLQGDGFTDACTQHVRAIPQLHELTLHATKITPEGVAQLAACRPLTHLTLSYASASAAHLEPLAAFPNLTQLHVTRSPVDNEGLRSLRRLARLEFLSLMECTHVTNLDAAQLGELTNLTTLHAINTPLNDGTWPAIGRMNKLQGLWLTSSALTDGGLSHLTSLPLKNVSLNVAVTDEGLQTLCRLRGLTDLHINACKITEAGLDPLLDLPDLIRLTLANSTFGDEGLLKLAKMQSLWAIDVGDNPRITKSGVEAFLQVRHRIVRAPCVERPSHVQ